MKRLFVLGFVVLATIPAAIAQQSRPFNWSGNHTFVETNDPPPQVDSPSFTIANGATFGVDLTVLNLEAIASLGDSQASILYQPSALNYTNKGILIGVPGFDFEYYPDQPASPQPGVPAYAMNQASTFANIANGLGGGAIYCTNIFPGFLLFSPVGPTAGNPLFPLSVLGGGLSFNGLATLKVNATNIIDSGLVSMDNTGLIDFQGQNLDLRRSQFSMLGGLGFAGYDILDWGSGGFGSNSLPWSPATQLTPTTASSPFFLSSANFFFEQMALTNSTPYFESLTGVGAVGGTIVWRGIFLQDFSPSNVTHNVYFENSLVGSGAFHVEWIGTVTNPLTGVLSTNYFYLSDVPVNRRATNFLFTVPPDSQSQFFGEFTLTESAIRLPLGFPTQPGFVQFTNLIVTNDFGYINAEPTPFVVTNEVFGGSATNVPGRLQLSASQAMNLADAQVVGPNYLLLSSPVNFQGNSNALINAPISDLNLGVPGQRLAISNLLNPNVPEWLGITNAPSAVFGTPMGGVQAFSGSFLFTTTTTNTVTTGTNTTTTTVTTTNDVRILLVNSALQPTGPAIQQDVKLHTGNDLFISDVLNIYGDFSSDAQVLTITTNGGGAFSANGELNFISPNIFWSTSLTNLQYLTNWGKIVSQNLTFFAGNMFDPYSDPTVATPYQAFINHGIITNGGVFIRADTFENSGLMDDPIGSIDIGASGDAVATNGSFVAPAGYVSIAAAGSLIASNGLIVAGGGSLTLSASCSLSDGYVLDNQFGHVTNSTFPYIVTNGNTWLTTGGVKITEKPPTADLLGTTITNLALNNLYSINTWPGVDKGATPQGFGDNLALGRMILNADSSSVFNFATVTGNNALYVDSIELQGNATNTDGYGNPLSIAIDSGMNIYYAQALENGVSIAEKLNGKHGAANINGGQFFWVSNYAGVYSSTNLLYPDNNTYIFNEALVISPDINSGGPDGTQTNSEAPPNKDNQYPIPTNQIYSITNLTGPAPCANGQGQNNSGHTNVVTSTPAMLTQLAFPAVETAASGGNGQGSGISFSVAQGSYNGLFYDTNGVIPADSGSFTAKMTPKGGFSAKLQLGSGVYSFSGAFDNSGHASNVVSGKNLATLNVDLRLTNNDQMIGSVSGSGWTSELLAERATTVSSSWVGKDTLLLSSDSAHGTTNTGQGYGSVTVSASGGVQWSGVLPDGTKLSEKSALSRSGLWPVYTPLYGGSGIFIGWLQCTNQSGPEVTGSAVWVMPAGHGMYPAGMTNQVNVSGSRINGSVLLPRGLAVLSGAALESSLTNKVTIIGKTIQSSNNAWKISLNPQTGLFSGSVASPNNGQKLLFQGAFLEKSSTGGGFFLNADQSGKVYFGPAE